METSLITEYYRAQKPEKRKTYLEQSIQAGEDPEKNEIRKMLYDLRYQEQKSWNHTEQVDCLMQLWMILEFNKNTGNSYFSYKNGRKEILKTMKKLQFQEIAEKSDLHRELLYQECCHVLRLYISLCEKDRSYRNAFMGLVSMSDDRVEEKIRNDIYQTAVLLPVRLELTKELELITQAARVAYAEHFPENDPLPENPEEEGIK